MTNSQYNRDDNFSQRGSKGKKGATIIKEGKMPLLKGDKCDDLYVLGPHKDVKNAVCHFCKMSTDKHTFIGPFAKKGDDQVASM